MIMPMMATTTMISTSVMPRVGADARSPPSTAAVHELLLDLHQLTKSFISMIGIRIENTMKPTEPPISTIITGSSSVVSRADLHVDLELVGARHVLEHRLELARALADGDHVGHDRRELARALERRRDRLALLDRRRLRLLDHLLEHGVPRIVLDDVERAQQRHARRQHRRQRAGEARDAIMRTSGPMTQQLEHDAIDDGAPARRALPATEAR